MDQLKKLLCSYFKILLEHRQEWNNLVSSSVNSLEALLNRTEQFGHVQRYKPEDEFSSKIRERILAKIRLGCEEEITLLNSIIAQLKSLNSRLKNKLSEIEVCYDKIEDSELTSNEEFIRGCGSQPSLALMMEYAEDTWKYYMDVYINITVNMKLVKYHKRSTVVKLYNSFKEDKSSMEEMEYILGFVNFFLKNVDTVKSTPKKPDSIKMSTTPKGVEKLLIKTNVK